MNPETLAHLQVRTLEVLLSAGAHLEDPRIICLIDAVADSLLFKKWPIKPEKKAVVN